MNNFIKTDTKIPNTPSVPYFYHLVAKLDVKGIYFTLPYTIHKFFLQTSEKRLTPISHLQTIITYEQLNICLTFHRLDIYMYWRVGVRYIM